MPVPWFPVQPKTPGASNEILILGQRYELAPTDADVRTYDQAGAFSYAVAGAARPLFERRWRQPGSPVERLKGRR